MGHIPAPAFAHSRGERPCKVMIVGEAHGESEVKIGRPLVGASGRELSHLLWEAGLSAFSPPERFDATGSLIPLTPAELDAYWTHQPFFMTNVFSFQPPFNKLIYCCGTKNEVGGKNYSYPPLLSGTVGPKYLLPEYLPELSRLKNEITACAPNIIIALGNTPSWALLSRTGITSIRGTTAECTLVPGYKVIPTFHPSNILRQWENRTIMLADLIKAKRESEFPEIRRPERQILVNPTISEIEDFYNYLNSYSHSIMAIDIETKNKTVTMISFSVSPDYALVIPFYCEHREKGNYWQDFEDEVKAWQLVGKLLNHPIPKLFQNGMYDIGYFYKMGFRPVNCEHDTMLLHHAEYPEMNKGLGFLGSLYSNEASWKLLRRVRAKEQSNKADE